MQDAVPIQLEDFSQHEAMARLGLLDARHVHRLGVVRAGESWVTPHP